MGWSNFSGAAFVKKIGKYLGLDINDKRNMKDSIEIAIQAVKENGWALEDLTINQREDRKIVIAAVKNSGCALQFASKKLRSDFDIVKIAVNENAWALEYASKELKSNREIVLSAVKQEGSSLRYANKELRDDIAIVKEAVKQNANALRSAGQNSKSNFDLILTAVKQNGSILQTVKKELREDIRIVQLAIKQDGDALQFAGSKFKKDKKIVLSAVKQNGSALQYANAVLKNDYDIVLSAVSNYGRALEYAGNTMKSNSDIINSAIKQDSTAIQFAGIDFKKNYFSRLPKADLRIECWNRGKEVYGVKYAKSKFDSKKFLSKYKNDYYNLSDESIESEIPFNENTGLKVSLNEVDFISRDGYNGGPFPLNIKIIELDSSVSYRLVLNATKNESCVVWFHDYVNTVICSWKKITDFDISKITVYIQTRLDDTDGTSYKIIKGIKYNDRDAIDEEWSGEPKSGYQGPFIL